EKGVQFPAQVWKSFQKGLGSKVKLSTIFHPQIDGYHSSIQIVLYEAIYGRRCRSHIGWLEVGEARLIGPDLVHQAMKKVKLFKRD
ncbi:hypothetical protein MTR67_027087, partial [Solanum verrucosum]